MLLDGAKLALGSNRFPGFPPETSVFLRDLTANNTREWLAGHREDYELFYIEPALAFIATLGPRLQEFAPGTKFEPRANGSLLRIHRDVRFSKDKTPYKTHLDLWFWQGQAKGYTMPGFFFRMEADSLILGGGMHHFSKEILEAYRAAILDPTLGGDLADILEEIKDTYPVGGATLKRVPRGFDSNHERAGLLRHEALYAGYEGPLPRAVQAPGLIDFCVGHFKALWPLVRWLTRVAGSTAGHTAS